MLVARAQLNFIRDLVARFERDNSTMRPVAEYQSQYIAIIALLRSVGHVFDKVDCTETDRRAWSRAQWPIWQQEPIFRDFIKPTRDALLKEFQGGLQMRSDAFGSPVFSVDPAMPGGTSQFAAFDARAARDLRGRPVLPQLHASMAFWDRCLREAETAFGEAPASKL